ncbi:hypothetical protein DFJ74DRAFT_670337 [Hyaloraphidium curvatum]|nr:hypothetical protein DFJ74DRAFT_670337 [Hyaloraphidium curvatum]
MNCAGRASSADFDLRAAVGNTDGQLFFPGTGLTSSCVLRSLSVAGGRAMLAASCSDHKGTPRETSLDLNYVLNNGCGVLKVFRSDCTVEGSIASSNPGATCSLDDNGFSQSCSAMRLDGFVLRASCIACDGTTSSTNIDLSRIITNSFGTLSFPGQDFALTCSSVSLVSSNGGPNKTLSASCRDGKVSTLYATQMDLDYILANRCGRLAAAGSGCTFVGSSSLASPPAAQPVAQPSAQPVAQPSAQPVAQPSAAAPTISQPVSGLSMGAIAGIAVGASVGAAALGAGLFVLLRRPAHGSHVLEEPEAVALPPHDASPDFGSNGDAPARPSPNEDVAARPPPNEDAATCVICMDRPKNTVVRPCKHLAMCAECAATVESCPLCRGRVASVETLFV